MHGIIPVFKPKGMTSHDVVNRIRRLTGIKKVGHTGTLDPEVEGVLPICVGQATRVAEYIQLGYKSYHGSLRVGMATDTEDQTGEIVDQVAGDVLNLSWSEIQEAFRSLQGEIEQTPPMYSAVKVDGQRLYHLARQGKTVERKKRQVMIQELTCTGWDHETYPLLYFQVRCSKGTYVRSLCVDIGKKLGYPAHMVSLVRTRTGPFHIEDCYSLEELETMKQEDRWNEILYELDTVLGQFPSVLLPEDNRFQLENGWFLECDEDLPDSIHLVRVYSESGRFCALYRKVDPRVLKPEKVFRDVE